MRVLFTTPVLENPAAGGPQLRIENSIKALSQVCDLYVVSRVSKSYMGGVEAEHFYSRYSKEFTFAPSVVDLNGNRYLRLLQRAYRKALPPSVDDVRYILKLVNKNRIDVIWFGYGNISFPLMKAIKRAMPNLRIVCDTDSVWSRFVLRELPFESDPVRREEIEKTGREKELEEEEWVNLCDITTAVSEVDAQYYRALAKDIARIKIFSNVIDLDSYKYVPISPDDLNKPCMYLAGSFGPKSPMDKAARWVIEEVLPLVRKEIPDIHFYIVGRGSIETLSDIDEPGITITGKLPSVLPYLCNADVALVPLKFESGTRFKIMEAAACGIPIVSTVLGAEGIPVTDGKDIILADEPQEFATGIVKTIQDKEFAKGLAENCKNLIQKHYSVEALAQEAKEILGYLKSLKRVPC